MSMTEQFLQMIGYKPVVVPKRKFTSRGRPKGKSWVTKFGEKIPIRKLTDDHLDNILRMLGRMHGELYPDLVREQRRRKKNIEKRVAKAASRTRSYFEDAIQF